MPLGRGCSARARRPSSAARGRRGRPRRRRPTRSRRAIGRDREEERREHERSAPRTGPRRASAAGSRPVNPIAPRSTGLAPSMRAVRSSSRHARSASAKRPGLRARSPTPGRAHERRPLGRAEPQRRLEVRLDGSGVERDRVGGPRCRRRGEPRLSRGVVAGDQRRQALAEPGAERRPGAGRAAAVIGPPPGSRRLRDRGQRHRRSAPRARRRSAGARRAVPDTRPRGGPRDRRAASVRRPR